MNDMKKITNRQLFRQMRFGMFIHWGLYSLTGKDMWYYSTEEVSREYYERLFKRFNPDEYRPDEWARLAVEAGMKYAVFTTKHHDGFCLWDTKFTDFKVTNTPYGKDVLRMWVDAFRNEGIKIGFYHSLIDWHHPDFTVDWYHPEKRYAEMLNKGKDFSRYVDYLHNQVRELMSEYGEVMIYWPDFSYPDSSEGSAGKGATDWQSHKLKEMVEELQPGILVNNRLGIPGKNEIASDFATPEQEIPLKDISVDDEGAPMWETCDTIGSSWGYCRGDSTIKPTGELIRRLVTCTSNNGNLLLNVGPTPRGCIQREFSERLSEIGEWLKYNGNSVYGCGLSKYRVHYSVGFEKRCVFTQREKDVYLHCLNAYPPFDITIPEMGGGIVDHVEFLADGTDIEFEEVDTVGFGLDGKKSIRLRMPAIQADPNDTVIHFVLK